jgi:hypothetical protein
MRSSEYPAQASLPPGPVIPVGTVIPVATVTPVPVRSWLADPNYRGNAA